MNFQLDILLRDFESNLDFIRKENNNEIIISFSGGKDSSILLNLVRKLKQKNDIVKVQVFSENFYPEIAAFIQKQMKLGKQLGEEWVFINSGWDLWKVWKTYGWFGNSKFIMRVIHNIQNILDDPNWKGWKYNKEESINANKKWLENFGLLHIFNDIIDGKRFKSNFSGKGKSCCNLIKNSQSKHDKWILTGMRSEEKNRNKIVCKDNHKKSLNIMRNWTEKNEEEAMKEFNIEICEIYKYVKRTGCMFCPFSGEKNFQFTKNRYYDKLSDENKAILRDMEKARAYFKSRK